MIDCCCCCCCRLDGWLVAWVCCCLQKCLWQWSEQFGFAAATNVVIFPKLGASVLKWTQLSQDCVKLFGPCNGNWVIRWVASMFHHASINCPQEFRTMLAKNFGSSAHPHEQCLLTCFQFKTVVWILLLLVDWLIDWLVGWLWTCWVAKWVPILEFIAKNSTRRSS
jgi:hypothetical protein